MLGNDTYLPAQALAVARHLQRAGHWDLALAVLPAQPAVPAAELRAEILVDRYLWRLDQVNGAEAAIATVAAGGNTALAALLRGQVIYWRLLFAIEPASAANGAEQAQDALAHAARGPRLAGWGNFWLGVLADNIVKDRAMAAGHYAQAMRLGRVS